MAVCFLMAIVIYLFYPVGDPAFSAILHSISLTFLRESAGKTLEEMDFLFEGLNPLGLHQQASDEDRSYFRSRFRAWRGIYGFR
jgi:hypothetical protein